MDKKTYLRKTLRDIKRDTANALKAKAIKREKEIKLIAKAQQAPKKSYKPGTSKLATVISNKAHQVSVQSKRPKLYNSSGKAYSKRKKT